MTQRRFYECPACRHTWAHRFPLGQLTNPYTSCPECGKRSAPKGTLAWKDSFCNECGDGKPELIVSPHGKLCWRCYDEAVTLFTESPG